MAINGKQRRSIANDRTKHCIDVTGGSLTRCHRDHLIDFTKSELSLSCADGRELVPLAGLCYAPLLAAAA
jgi:hypothetical protein